jgi:two-component system chemotaxis response regulator CheY
MKLNILIVDDSSTIRTIMRSILEKLGHNIVAEAKDGSEAIESFFEHTPDFITMDVKMPGMSGVDAIEKIKKLDKTVKVVMITAHGQEKLVKDAIKKGANDYILKPITADKIKKSINKLFPDSV